MCAKRSREGAASHHPNPQHPRSCPPQSPGDTFPRPHISFVCWLTRVRCPLDSGLGAPSSQELLTAWGAAVLEVLRAPWSHVAAMSSCTSQADSGADATSRVTAALGGGPTALHPRDGKAVTPWCDPKLPPSSLPAPRPPACNIPSHPIRPAQPRAAEQGLPKIAHTARPSVLLPVGWGWGELGALTCRLQPRRVCEPGRGRAAPRHRLGPSARGANSFLLPHSLHLPSCRFSVVP